RQRPWQLRRALEIVAGHRRPATPVVVARDVGRPDERVEVVTLDRVPLAAVDMRTVLLVGSSTTRVVRRAGAHPVVYTPRSYPADPA
ncbi:MAG TPA: hypothetical protein VGG23_04540, partial [Acidimicrobiales bacterium]